MLRRILSLVLLLAVLAGCNPASASLINPGTAAQISEAGVQVAGAAVPVALAQPGVDVAAKVPETDSASAASAAAAPTAVAAAPLTVGPNEFPAGVNPLTGLPVKNVENLALSPALVSVTNFPTTARPQAGLSYTPFVYEMYIGEGMTRFLALFYGDYPQKNQDTGTGIALADDRVGPIRSGRLPYESLRKLYNGFLVMSSGSSMVLPSLSSYNNVFGSDTTDINSAMVPATKLEEIATKNPTRLKNDALSGLQFSTAAPASGQAAGKIWIPFSYLNQVIWKFDAASGAYQRFQDNADGKTFIQATDRLNKQPLAYSNVVVLFANHDAKRETLIDINLMYINKMPALLFRDGKMYKIYWTTANGDYEKRTGRVRPIRFVDEQGNPFPLKPGQTWVEMVQPGTPYNETVDSQSYQALKTQNQPGSGVWAIHFFPTVADR